MDVQNMEISSAALFERIGRQQIHIELLQKQVADLNDKVIQLLHEKRTTDPLDRNGVLPDRAEVTEG